MKQAGPSVFSSFWDNGDPLAIVPKSQPAVGPDHHCEEAEMKDKLSRFTAKISILLNEEGQDLIEYALIVALVAFAATAGMSTLAVAINNAFTNVGTTLTTYIT